MTSTKAMTLIAVTYHTPATRLAELMPVHEGYYLFGIPDWIVSLHNSSEMIGYLSRLKLLRKNILSRYFLTQDKTGC